MPSPIAEFVVRRTSPRYTVGAMCRIVRDDGRVLMVRPGYRTEWALPGGLVRWGEDPLDCAHREVLEEAGLRITIPGEPIVVVSPAERIIDVVYHAVPGEDPDHARPASAEIVAVAWVLPEDVLDRAGALAHKIRAGGIDGSGPRLVVLDAPRRRYGRG